MHVKTDSEGTTLSLSSADPSRQPLYYVQSPSRDSHDEEKTATSFQSTPVLASPMGSPPNSNSFRHSRESSTSRFSGLTKPESRKVALNDARSGGREKRRDFDVVEEEEEEEGLLEDEKKEGFTLRCSFMGVFLGFFVLFLLFALILWSVSKHQKPKITMMNIKLERFGVQAGSDDSGVSTDMITVNSTLKFNYRNRGRFFGVDVSSTHVALSYSHIKIGSANINKFYKKRNEDENVTVIVIGDKIPMYGAGVSLSTSTGMTTLPVRLELELMVRSRGYVLGKLVKPGFYNKVYCSIYFNMKKLNALISLKNSCIYAD